MRWCEVLQSLDPVGFAPDPDVPAMLGVYRIQRQMRSSAMALVVTAVVDDPGDPTNRDVVVIKQQRRSREVDGQLRRRDDEALLSLAEREYGACCLLGEYENFPRMVGLLGNLGAETDFATVQEYVDGPTLEVALKHDADDRHEMLIALAWKLLGAVQTMHVSRVVHRDLKCSNVIVRTQDMAPVIIDFNACSAVDGRDVTGLLRRRHGPTAGVGTPGYEAPEEFAARRDRNPMLDVGTGDIWRWAVIVWQMFASKPGMPLPSPADALAPENAHYVPGELRRSFELALGRASQRPAAFKNLPSGFQTRKRDGRDEVQVLGTRYVMETRRRVAGALARAHTTDL